MLKAKTAQVNFCDEGEQKLVLNDRGCDLPSQRKFKDSGAMIAPAIIARTGIMEYRAGQCGALFADRDPNSIVRIMTEACDLFDSASLESYHSAPITIDHPSEDVTVDNAGKLQKGHLDGVPFADEEEGVLRANIVLSDSEAIDTVEAGTSQLSSGHSCTLVLADEGDDFDAKKTDIRANHVAIVAVGRAGVAEIADKEDPTKELELKLEDAEKSLTAAKTEVDTVQAKLDDALEQNKELEAKLADSEAAHKAKFDDAVKSRVEFIASVQRLCDLAEDILLSKTEKEVKLIILEDKLGKDFSQRSDDYIEARFDSVMEREQTKLDDEADDDNNSIAAALADSAKAGAEEIETAGNESENARQKMIDRNSKK